MGWRPFLATLSTAPTTRLPNSIVISLFTRPLLAMMFASEPVYQNGGLTR